MVSQKEKLQLQEVRENLDMKFANELEDWLLLVYLRACKMDVQMTGRLFERSMEVEYGLTGRIGQKLDYLKYTSLEEISSDMIYKYLGCGNDGRPAGRWNPRRHIEKGLTKEFWLHVFKCFHEAWYQLYELGEKTGVHQNIVLIVDLKGLTFTKVANYELAQTALGILQDFQKVANILHKIYVVDAPWITHCVMRFMKPFLKKTTSKKIEQLNLNESDWKRILRKKFPVDILPIEYGGNVICR